MINFSLKDFCVALDLVRQQAQQSTVLASQDRMAGVTEPHKTVIHNNFEYISKQCTKLALERGQPTESYFYDA